MMLPSFLLLQIIFLQKIWHFWQELWLGYRCCTFCSVIMWYIDSFCCGYRSIWRRFCQCSAETASDVDWSNVQTSCYRSLRSFPAFSFLHWWKGTHPVLSNTSHYLLLLHYTRLTALCPGLTRWAGTRKVKPIWILLKQETVSGSGISWVVCKSAPHSRQTTTPAPHLSVFLQAGCPSYHPTNSVKALKAVHIIYSTH